MNETTTTMADWSKDEQEFADVIIKIYVSKYKHYEQEHLESRAHTHPKIFWSMNSLSSHFYQRSKRRKYQ